MTNLAGLPPRQRVPSFVSQKLRDFARGQDCAMQMPWCNRNPETTVLCHVRAFGMAGVAMKPHDFHGYHGCSECHRREKYAGWDDFLRAMMITQARVYAEFGTLTP
jgi:Protein of unknown function (DUF1364)